MTARWTAVLLLAMLATPATAQPPWQFRWQKGQALTYKARHVTTVAEIVDGGTVETVSKLDLVKRWDVADVDADGVATLKLTLVALRNEQKRPDGEVLLFDSADVGKGTPELREQMGKFVGQTLAELRLDAQGRAVEVKQGPAARYEAEPPFALVFPKAVPEAGQQWLRPYTIVLEPPQGTGEKVEAKQRYHCTKLADGKATIDVVTEFVNPPESVQERIPLLQKDVRGQMVFDTTTGSLVSVRLNIDRTLEGHQGPGSSYRFQSEYSEELREP